MARGSNQKMKSMYLMQLFLDKTDETHYITMVDILNYLSSNDINAERKSIYADIEALKQYGLDIKGFQEKGRKTRIEVCLSAGNFLFGR